MVGGGGGPVKVSLAAVSRNFMTFIRESVSGLYEFEPIRVYLTGTQHRAAPYRPPHPLLPGTLPSLEVGTLTTMTALHCYYYRTTGTVQTFLHVQQNRADLAVC